MSHRFYIPGVNGAVAGEFIVEGDKVHRRLVSNTRDRILERNRELRKNPDALKTTSFGKMEFDIPIDDFPFLNSQFPGLSDPSHPEHRWAWNCFKRSPVSAPYRIVEMRKGVNRRI